MDKINQYKRIVRTLVEEVAAMAPSDEQVENQLITDNKHGHYLLYSVGWENEDYREYGSFVHIDIKADGKIWIQHDGTDLKLALLLIEQGVPKDDIVLGFRAPFRREPLVIH